MKLFKYTVLALALAAGFTACSDNDDFVPGAASEGVYFPSDDPREIDLDRNESAFDVTVARAGDTDAATYALVGHADDEVFTLPTSVSFAQGETTATVSVAYRKDAMGLDKAYKVELGFAEGTQICNFGNPSLEMAVTLPAPWITVGKGTYQDILVLPCYYEFENDYITYECELQQHEIDPTRYRWLHPYGENFAKACAADGLELSADQYDSKGQYNLEFIVKDGYAAIPYQATGVTINNEEGMVYIGTLAGIYLSNGNTMEELIGGAPETLNIITFDKHDVTKEDGSVEEDVEFLATVFQQPGNIRLNFEPNPSGYYKLNSDPGGYNWWEEGVEIKDYALDLTYRGVLNTPDENSVVLASVKLGEDIDHAKIGMVQTAVLEEAIEAVASDAVATQELKEDKDFPLLQFEYSGSADYALAIIGYNEEGEEVGTNAITFFVADAAAPKEWSSLGTGIMVDGWFTGSFSANGVRVDPMEYAYEVNMEENIENPGVYRIMAPWTTDEWVGVGAGLNKYDGKAVNIVVDARDSEWITIAPQFSGYVNSAKNYFWASSFADAFYAQGYSKEELADVANYFDEEYQQIIITGPSFFPGTDAATAPDAKDCAYSFYTKEPYSEEFEYCPGIFQLPGDENAPAKIAIRHLEHKAGLQATNHVFRKVVKALAKQGRRKLDVTKRGMPKAERL